MDLTSKWHEIFPDDICERYGFIEVRNASAVLSAAAPDALTDIVEILSNFHLDMDDVLGAGGNKSAVAARLDKAFRERGWREARLDTRINMEVQLEPYWQAGEKQREVSKSEVFSEGYKVDNFKGRVALDVEWNAKEGHFDRDLGGYRNFYDAGNIDVAVILTRTHHDMKQLASALDPDSNKFRTSTTTHIENLRDRLVRGDAGGCPVLGIAISSACYTPPEA